MDNILEIKAKLLGSLLLFTQYFYKERTGRDFVISQPAGRESHHITVCRAFTDLFYQRTSRLLINIPPGHGKSELTIHFIAWALAHYPDCNFMYISYSQTLAAKHTFTIKRLMELPLYRQIFGVQLASDSKAKDNFRTTAGGSVIAFGSEGSIAGQDAGLPHLHRFGGCPIYDDPHNLTTVFSDVVREGVIESYDNSVNPRVIRSGKNGCICVFGQRGHEGDLFQYLIDGKDGYEWKSVILESEDAVGNVLYPELMTKEMLNRLRLFSPYVYWAQQQQKPIPAGGGIFKSDWFHLAEDEPQFLATFITADTSETSKDYNDATVFSFWGIHYIKQGDIETDILGLHWIDCLEIRVEPAELQHEFLQFYAGCMRHKNKPRFVAIEKKSTGVTLLSILKGMQGLQMIDVERTKASGSKTVRYLEAQPYAAERRISLPIDGKHTRKCIAHMEKITANDSHRFDDICDTFYDAVKIGLIDQTIVIRGTKKNDDAIARKVTGNLSRLLQIRGNKYGNHR